MSNLPPHSDLPQRLKRGAAFLGLRQNIFTDAQETFAYDVEVTYVVTGKKDAAITRASDLNVVLYFDDKKGRAENAQLNFGRTQAMGVT